MTIKTISLAKKDGQYLWAAVRGELLTNLEGGVGPDVFKEFSEMREIFGQLDSPIDSLLEIESAKNNSEKV